MTFLSESDKNTNLISTEQQVGSTFYLLYKQKITHTAIRECKIRTKLSSLLQI